MKQTISHKYLSENEKLEFKNSSLFLKPSELINRKKFQNLKLMTNCFKNLECLSRFSMVKELMSLKVFFTLLTFLYLFLQIPFKPTFLKLRFDLKDESCQKKLPFSASASLSTPKVHLKTSLKRQFFTGDCIKSDIFCVSKTN